MRHVELSAVPQGEVPMVCISPGRATLFSFDAELQAASLTLEAREGFSLVEQGGSTLKLVPSEGLTVGRRLLLTVGFKDNAAPTRTAFVLVVQAAQAEPLVNVYRQARSVESYAQELDETKAQVRQLRDENTRLHREKAGPGGIVGLLASRLMDVSGVPGREITWSITKASTNTFRVLRVNTYHSAVRVAAEVVLFIPTDAPAWKPVGASLTLQGRRGAELKIVTLWPAEPLAPGPLGKSVFVEAEATAGVAKGPFALKLWDASGSRTVTISGITFQ